MPTNEDRMSTGLSSADTSAISETLERLCNHSVAKIPVPKFDVQTDIHEFISEFERSTSTLSDQQKLLVLPKAFPGDSYRSWYGTELAPLIKANASWKTVKDTIISRFAVADVQDKHFCRLRELKYNMDGEQSLMSFVEDILYSYERAYPNESVTSALKYVKMALPPSLKAKLNLYSDFKDASNVEMLKSAIKEFDLAREASPRRTNNKDSNLELVNLIKDLMINVKKENQAIRDDNKSIREEMAAAFRSFSERRPRSPYRQNSPTRVNYQSQQGTQGNSYSNFKNNRVRSPYDGSSRRQYQPGQPQTGQYARQRSPSPANNRNATVANTNNRPPTPFNTDRQASESVEDDLFNIKVYNAKFGKPIRPCKTCQKWHWDRHCIEHLN